MQEKTFSNKKKTLKDFKEKAFYFEQLIYLYMVELSNSEKASEKVSHVKRNCSFCKARSRLRSKETERELVKAGLKNLIAFYNDQYNDLRRKDAPVSKINNAIENKRQCMDLLEECSACDKEIDHVNRGLNKIK